MAHVAGGRAPSLSVAVFQHGVPVWVEAFGSADRERGVAATTSTPYAIASASKPVTATLVASLIASARLSLDTPVGDRIKGLAADVSGVSLRELLQHRSGIPRHWRNAFAGQDGPAPFMTVARDHGFTTAARGRRYLYSNMNYGLLAAVAEDAGGDLGRQLRTLVFDPAGMTGAGFLDGHFADWRAATPYEDDGAPIPPYRVDESGARDLVMTAGDLARFGVAHIEGRFGAAAALMVSERAEIEANGVSKASYGLGWIIEEESPASLFTYGHTGEGPGAAASLAIVPDEQMVVVTLSNAQGPATYMLNEAIVDAISPRFAERRSAHPYVEPPADDAALRTLEGRWRGRMETPDGVHPVTLALSGDGESTVTVAGAAPAVLSRLTVKAGVFGARADLTLPVAEARRWPHQTRILLDQDGAALDGSIAAYAGKGPIPHEQFWLSYRLRLEREA